MPGSHPYHLAQSVSGIDHNAARGVSDLAHMAGGVIKIAGGIGLGGYHPRIRHPLAQGIIGEGGGARLIGDGATINLNPIIVK